MSRDRRDRPDRPDRPDRHEQGDSTAPPTLTPQGDDVPHAVLDELRQAFTGTPPGGLHGPDGPGTLGRAVEPDPTQLGDPADRPDDHTDFTLDDLTLGDLTLDDLPAAEVDDLRDLSADESGAGFHSGADDSVFAEPWLLDVPDLLDLPEVPDLPDLTDGDPLLGRAGDAPDGPTGSASRGSASTSSAGASTTGKARPTIVIGGDDSLPDAVYLDDDQDHSSPVGHSSRAGRTEIGSSVDGTGERGTIVIGDELEASGAFDAVSVPSRSMDPRVRARRIAVKRAQGRKRLLLVAGIGGAVVVVVAVLAVFSSSLFAVERVDVQGAPYTRERYGDRLQAVIDDLMGEPVLLVDTAAAEQALEALPWVERAFVTTDFPDRVLIDVRERQPLATFQGSDGRYRVIDRDGFVLDVLDGRPADYMLIDGVGPDLETASSAGSSYAAAAQLVGALPAEIRDLTLGATLDPTTGDLGLLLQIVPTTGDPATGEGTDVGDGSGAPAGEPVLVTVRIGSFTGVDGKLARLLQLVRDGIDDGSGIDVSTDDVIG